MDFREMIKTELKRQGMSVPKLARLAELNQATIYNYFGGREIMSDTLIKILKALNIKNIDKFNTTKQNY